MAKDDPEEIEERHRELATQLLDLVFPEKEEDEEANEAKARAFLAAMDPLEAAAVTLHAAHDLEPEQIGELLMVIEDTVPDEDDDT